MLEALGLDLTHLEQNWLSLASLLPILLAACFGFLILLVYVTSSGKEKRDRNLHMVIPVLCILMSVIMRVEGAQIVLFFGIFGILSIVRFRSEITDQKGITFILFAVIQGVLVGVANYLLAGLAFVIVAAAIYLSRLFFGLPPHFRLIFKVEDEVAEARSQIETWLTKQGLNFHLTEISVEQSVDKRELWERKRRLEFELRTAPGADYLRQIEAVLDQAQAWGYELEVKKSGEG